MVYQSKENLKTEKQVQDGNMLIAALRLVQFRKTKEDICVTVTVHNTVNQRGLT